MLHTGGIEEAVLDLDQMAELLPINTGTAAICDSFLKIEKCTVFVFSAVFFLARQAVW